MSPLCGGAPLGLSTHSEGLIPLLTLNRSVHQDQQVSTG